MRGLAWLRDGAVGPRKAGAVTVAACAAVAALACGALPADGALPAYGETGPASGTGAGTCASLNPPNALTLLGGTPQSATLGSAFATNLQVAFTNSNGCPVTSAVAGTPVTFSAPTVGASGLFAASGSSTVTVGSDGSGMAVAPAFTADDTAGSYTVKASSTYGSVSFSLTNAEGGASRVCGAASGAVPSTDMAPASLAGRPTKLTAGIGASQSTSTGTNFPLRLAVTVTDAEKTPVPGALVVFVAPARGPSGHFTIRSRSSRGARLHTLYPRRVEVRTDACGVAVAPAFTADRRRGGYVVTASVENVRTAFALVNEGP
jgi:hypothetical protein